MCIINVTVVDGVCITPWWKLKFPPKIKVTWFCTLAVRLKLNMELHAWKQWHLCLNTSKFQFESSNWHHCSLTIIKNTWIITWFTWQIEWFHLFSQNAPRSSDRDESCKCSRTGLLTHRKLLCHNSWGKMRRCPWILQLFSKLNIVMRTFKINHTCKAHY